MTAFALVLLGLTAALACTGYAAFRSPFGYEDRRGFLYGAEIRPERSGTSQLAVGEKEVGGEPPMAEDDSSG